MMNFLKGRRQLLRELDRTLLSEYHVRQVLHTVYMLLNDVDDSERIRKALGVINATLGGVTGNGYAKKSGN